MTWHQRTLCGFDTETTGVDPESDRIVSAAVVLYDGGRAPWVTRWLADPGVDIPPGATAVHGITSELARSVGRPAADVVTEVTAALVSASDAGWPIVVMNAPFDLTLLEREAERYGVPSLFSTSEPLVLDPLVLDKQVDRFRPGSRRLEELCRAHGVTHGGAHDAAADAVAACAVTEAIAYEYPWVARTLLTDLHEQQVRWAADQQTGLRNYFAATPGKKHRAASVRTEWPLVPPSTPAFEGWGS